MKDSKCLQTRSSKDGFVRRRYERSDGVRYTTIEVPIEVWVSINRQGRAHDRAVQWVRARQREATKIKALDMMRTGWDALSVSSFLNVSKRTVLRWRKDNAPHSDRQGTR